MTTLAMAAWQRLTFGPHPDDQPVGGRRQFEDLLEAQLHPEDLDDRACDRKLARFRETLSDTVAATFIRAVHSQRQLQCVLADVWHDHFSVYGPWVASEVARYDRDVIRAHALGNFHDLMEAVASSSAMTSYLKALDRPASHFHRLVAAGEPLDRLAAHPATARLVCEKLCRRLVDEHPCPDLVERAMTAFIAHAGQPDQLRRVVRTIFLSADGFDTSAPARRPFEFTIALLRRRGARLDWVDAEFLQAYDDLGQPLFACPNPEGYPDSSRYWQQSPAFALGRVHLAEAIRRGAFAGISQ